MASKTLQVIITGKADKAIKALDDTGKAAGGLQGKMMKAGAAVGATLLAGGAAAAAFGVKSAKTFETVGSEVLLLQRRTGLGTEEASKLRFAFQQSGVTIQKGSAALGIFSKAVVKSKDGQKDFGFAVRDSHGNLLPMNELMMRAADQLHGMKDGTEKNVLAMKLFGRGGLDMVKVMGRGRQGLMELGDEAQKYGLVLTKDNAEAVKKAIHGHRLQTAAWQGLQVTIGAYVLPVLAKAQLWLAQKIPTALAAVKGFIDRNREGFRNFGESVAKVAGQAQHFAETVMSKVRPALEAVQRFIAQHPAGALQALAAVIGGVLVVSFVAWAASAAAAAAATIAATWPILAIMAAVAALAAGLVYAYTHWKTFHNVVDAVGRFIKGTVWPLIQAFARGVVDEFRRMAQLVGSLMSGVRTFIVNPVRSAVGTVKGYLGGMTSTFRGIPGRIAVGLRGVWTAITDPFRKALNWIKGAFSNLHLPSIGGIHIPGFASGTMSAPSGFAIVGENGPELVRFSGGERVYPASTTAGMVSAGRPVAGGSGPTILHVYIDGQQVEAVVRTRAQDRQAITGKPWLG